MHFTKEKMVNTELNQAADRVEKDFLDALHRLVEGKPNNKKLISLAKEGKLKINASNVALEAKRSRTLIALEDCRYPKVRVAIELAKGGQKSEPTTYAHVIKNLHADLAALKTENKQLQSKISAYFQRAKAAEKAAERDRRTADRLREEIRSLQKVAYLPEQQASSSPRLVLIRGLPGSGKSTKAKAYLEEGYEHFEADMFFIHDGCYMFDQERLNEAHDWCLSQTREALARGSHVVVANVFATKEDLAPYTSLGFDFEILEAKGRSKSVHGVPIELMEAMRARWIPTAKLIESLKSRGKVTRIGSVVGRRS